MTYLAFRHADGAIRELEINRALLERDRDNEINIAKAANIQRQIDEIDKSIKVHKEYQRLLVQGFINKSQQQQPQPRRNNDKKSSRSPWIYICLIFVLPLLVYIICELAETKSKSEKISEDSKHPIENTKGFADTTIFIDEVGDFHKIEINDIERFSVVHPGARRATEGEILRDIASRREKYLNELEANRPKNGASPYDSFYGKGVYIKSSLSEITIENGTPSDAVVRFLKISTGQTVRNIYIRANSSYTAKQFPDGIYEMKCCYGSGWDSDLNNGNDNPKGGFVSDASYSAASSPDDYFDLIRKKTKNGYNYPTYSVTLHKIVNGNMQTKEISMDDFFN